MKQERPAGAKHKMLSIHGRALPKADKKQDNLADIHIMPRPAKTSASDQTGPLPSAPGQGAPVPMSSLPAGARLYWLPVLFAASDIRKDTPSEGQRLEERHETYNAKPSSDTAGRRAKRERHAFEHSRYVYGPLVLDASRREVSVNGHEIELTLKEFGLLEYFLKHPGYVRTREMLLNAVWGYDYYGTTRTVDVHVRRIKKKIPLLTSVIISVHSLGYKLRDGNSSSS
ncbi:MAG: response regulator transcription factor [Nitrospira sp.]|mgnify:CR=1 FL=1|nr:response regulator transcription factor [Nitrospira sp.]